MKVVSFINYKGGVGKTTLAANVAAELANRGKRVLVIDLDPQSNFTFSFFKVDVWKNNFQKSLTIKNWFDDVINDKAPIGLDRLMVKPTTVNKYTKDNLNIICSHLGLINVDLELAVKLGGVTTKQMRHSFLKVHSYLREGLASIKDKYDVAIIDCPPNFNIVTKNALAASDFYVVPAKPDYLSTLGIEELNKNINELVIEYNEAISHISSIEECHYKTISPTSLGMIANMVEVRDDKPISTHGHYINHVKGLGIPVFKAFIRENKTHHASAPDLGIPLVLKKPTDKTTAKLNLELRNLASEFIDKVGI